MKTPASRARENSIALEAKKDGLQQRQSGDWMLRFTVAEMHPLIAAAAMGTRYQMVLVEIDDNEEAVDHVAIERDKWRNLGAAKQAGIRCKDPVFWAFLREHMNCTAVHDEEAAAIMVRRWCVIKSRSDLNKPGKGDRRQLWHELDNMFQAWRAKENA